MGGCTGGKDVYPDLLSALTSRNALIWRFGAPLYVVCCFDASCGLWHLTKKKPYGTKQRRWNNLDTSAERAKYDAMVADAKRVAEHLWVL
jgi:hypothetical protein